MSLAIVESLLKKASRNLSRVNEKRGQQIKAQEKVKKLKAQIASIEEMIADFEWDAACAGNEADSQESCFQHNMDMARREFTKDIEGDNAAKYAQWHKFIMTKGFY